MAPSGMTILTPDSGEDRTPPWEVNLPLAVATTWVSSSRDSKSLQETQELTVIEDLRLVKLLLRSTNACAVQHDQIEANTLIGWDLKKSTFLIYHYRVLNGKDGNSITKGAFL